MYQAEKIRKDLLKEIESGGPEFPLLKEIAPPGQRYLLIGKRDPFRPLLDPRGLVSLSETEQKPRARLLGDELKNVPPIALLVFAKIEDQHPKLYRSLKYFERLINDREALEEMADDDKQELGEVKKAINRNNARTACKRKRGAPAAGKAKAKAKAKQNGDDRGRSNTPKGGKQQRAPSPAPKAGARAQTPGRGESEATKQIRKDHVVNICGDFANLRPCTKEKRQGGCTRGWHLRPDLAQAKKAKAKTACAAAIEARRLKAEAGG